MEQLAAKLIPKERPQVNKSLDDWIRAEDLYNKHLFSQSTLSRYYRKGLIGKSTIGGVSCYYIPDIVSLLESKYVKKEEIQKMLRKEAA